MADNRRKNSRVPCGFEAKAFGPRGTLRATVRNLSVGGLYLATKDPLPVGTVAEVELLIDGQKLKATAEVRHHQRMEDLPGMGLKFVRLEPSTIAAIQKFVELQLREITPETP